MPRCMRVLIYVSSVYTASSKACSTCRVCKSKNYPAAGPRQTCSKNADLCRRSLRAHSPRAVLRSTTTLQPALPSGRAKAGNMPAQSVETQLSLNKSTTSLPSRTIGPHRPTPTPPTRPVPNSAVRAGAALLRKTISKMKANDFY